MAGASKGSRWALAAGWLLRALLVAAGVRLWFYTQGLISLRGLPGRDIGDRLLEWTAPVHDWLAGHSEAADGLLIVSSAIINLLAVFLLAWSIFGRSVRPFLGLLMLLALRQVCQTICALPAPPGMIWHQPALPAAWGGWHVPGLLVTYGTAYDFFFSGHTAIAVYGAVEVARLGRRSLVVLAVAIAVFELAVVILLRAHWSMDVFAGAVTALLVAHLAARLAPACDRALAALTRQAKE